MKKNYIKFSRDSFSIVSGGKKITLPKIDDPENKFLPRNDDCISVYEDEVKNKDGKVEPVTCCSIDNKEGKLEAFYTIYESGMVKFQRNGKEYFKHRTEFNKDKTNMKLGAALTAGAFATCIGEAALIGAPVMLFACGKNFINKIKTKEPKKVYPTIIDYRGRN